MTSSESPHASETTPKARTPDGVRRSDLTVMAPWLVLGVAEFWFMGHGFTRHDLQQVGTEVLCIFVLGACHARFAPEGAWRSPLIPAAVATAWTRMVLEPDVFGWIGAVVAAWLVVGRLERSKRWGVVAGVIASLLAAVGVRWQVLHKASGGEGQSVAREPLAIIKDELRAPTWPSPSGGDGPPLVLITVDTLRADAAEEMESYSRLAERGRAWSRASSTSSWTVPGVASIITGVAPEVHGAGIDKELGFQGIAPGVETLADVLGEKGYFTAAFTTNAWLAGGLHFERGFDLYRHGDANFMHRLVFMGFPNGPKAHEAEAVVDEALLWLDSAPERGWFLWVHLIDPHLPFLHNEGTMESALDDKWLRAGMRHNREIRERVRAAYKVEVDYADSHLVRLYDALEARGVLDNGVVVMTADHGEEFWDHGSTGHGHQHHTEVVDVGFAVAGAGVARGDGEGQVSVMDAAATLAAAGGASMGGDGGGIDLRSGVVPEGRIVVAQGNAYFEQPRSARSATGRAIFSSVDDNVGLCFDLLADPDETSGGPCAFEDEVAGVAKGVAAPEHREGEEGLSAGQMEALKKLGYVQ